MLDNLNMRQSRKRTIFYQITSLDDYQNICKKKEIKKKSQTKKQVGGS